MPTFCRCRARDCALRLVPWGIVALLLLVHSPGSAQTLKFQHVTIEDGLSQGSVECILQDSRGFLWFCTRDGLNRYDGRRVKVFKHDRGDPNSISNNFVRHMIEDADGRFWIATKRGLNRFDPELERFERFVHADGDSTSLSSDNVMRVLRDRSGRLWVGTWGGGLNRFDDDTGTFTRYGRELHDSEFARGNIVNCIFESSDSTLWVAAITGLFSCSPDRGQWVRHDLADAAYNGARDNIVIHMYEDRDGALWLGTYTGLIRFGPATGAIRRYPLDASDPKNIAANQVRYVAPAPGDRNELWMCTASRGLATLDLDSGEMTFHQHDPEDPLSIAHNSLWSMMEDRSGTLWVGTAGRGVDKLTPMATRFAHVSNLPGSNTVWSFCEDRRGDLWVGTNAGLAVMDGRSGEWTAVPHRSGDPASIGDGAVYSILEDDGGTLWFATETTGLSYTDRPEVAVAGQPVEFGHHRADSDDGGAISADRLFSLFEDRDGNLWVGTVDEGVDVLGPERDTFIHYRPDQNNPNSINDNGIECIYQDAAGDFWFGTLAGGLNRLERGSNRFTHYTYDENNPSSLTNNHVSSVLEDAAGNLWVATADGLNRMDPERLGFQHYFETRGLPNNYVYGLLLDDHGHLWLSTNLGLSRLVPENETFRNFTTRDGLQSNEFNAGAFHRGSSGMLFFGGHNGFNRFRPGGIHDNPLVPPVVLTSFQVLGEPVHTNPAIYAVDELTLSYRDYFFSFEFASLDYWAPERNRYQYRMDGLDADWIDAGTRNFVSYTHLDPGRYTFRVRGSNSDGVWNQEGAAVAIVITPPFWKRGWFIAMMAALVVASALAWHRYRLNRLLEIERLRTRISSDLHDEIATNLSSIAMFSGMIESQPTAERDDDSARLLSRLRELAEESVGSIRDIIWAINPAPQTLHALIVRLHDMLIPVCRARGIELVVDVPGEADFPAGNLPPERRQHLWLFLKEAVNNAIKHAGCTTLSVQTTYRGGRLSVVIADNGSGFDPEATYEGNGLRTMRMRAEQLRGDFTIESLPGEGTAIRMTAAV